MANVQQMRDPKTGRMLSKFESLAKQSALQASQHGQSGFEQELLAMEAGVEDDTRAVKGYVSQLVELVRNQEGSAAGLRQILPLITETARVAQKEDPTLSDAEKRRIKAACDKLAKFIQARTTLSTRLGARLSDSLKRRGRGLREGVSEHLASSESGLFRFMGRMLRPKDDDGREHDTGISSLLKAKSKLFGNIARSQKVGVGGAKSSMSHLDYLDDDDDDIFAGLDSGRSRSRRRRRLSMDDDGDDLFGSMSPRRSRGGEPGTLDTGTLGAILTEAKGIHSLLRDEREARIRDAEQSERDADNQSVSPARILETAKPEKKGTGLLGLLGGLLGAFINPFKKGLGLLDTAARIAASGLRLLPGIVSGTITAVTKGYGAVKAGFIAIKAALSSGALMTAAPIAVAAAQAWMANELAKISNDLHEQYPFLNRGDKGIKDDVDAVANLPGNVEKALSSKKVLEPKGGFLTTEEWAESRKMGLQPQEYKEQTNTLYSKRHARKTDISLSSPEIEDAAPSTSDVTPSFSDEVSVSAPMPAPVAPPAPTTPQRTPAPAPTLETNTSPKRYSDKFNYESYKEALGKRESGSDYSAVNRSGYLGKYQMGVMALETEGLMKPGTSKKGQSKAIVYNPKNWTIDGGAEAFLSNPELQERTMKKYTERNRKTLKRIGLITEKSDSATVSGLLAASHLLGPGDVKKKGLDGQDGFGTTGREYFAIGQRAQLATPAPMPTMARSAAPVAQHASAASTTNNTVVAPTTVVNNQSGGQQRQPTPRRHMPTENPDAAVRAALSING